MTTATPLENFLAGIEVKSWDQHIGQDGAIAIANAIRSAGYTLVPREPPDKAVEAGNWVHDHDGEVCYRKMVSAASII